MVGLQPSEPSSRSDIRKVEREATTVAILTIFAARATPDSWVIFQFFPPKALSSGEVSEKNVKSNGIEKSAMMGGVGDLFLQISSFYVLWETWCAVHADKLLKQLDCEVTIFLSDWYVVDAEETGDIDED